MDEDEISIEIDIKPMRHDKWSVLILGLNWVTQVAEVTANSLEHTMIAVCQHANQVKYDNKFKEMIDRGL